MKTVTGDGIIYQRRKEARKEKNTEGNRKLKKEGKN